MDISDIAKRAWKFRARLDSVKRSLAVNFSWYPYQSIANIDHFKDLLHGDNRRLLDLTENRPVLDVGAGDGDLSFFLESLGCTVHAIDHPVPNRNAMAGVRALKAALGSAVEIHVVDLDERFELPGEGYGLALMLGVLYHLRNPFYVLEKLSRSARYCLLSTRIARVLPDGAAVDRQPVAYLLDDDELNADATNYWIFSEAGLRRLMKRTNWEVLEYMTRGAADSDPVERDERAFCLLRSCHTLGRYELLEGWHAAEGGGWRWTARKFAVALPARASAVTLRVYVPENVIRRFGSVTLSGSVEGATLPAETWSAEGEYSYIRRLPETAGGRLEFELDQSLPPDDSDRRERGIIVNGLEFR